MQPCSAQRLSIRRIQTVVTRELFRHCCCPIGPMRQGLWHDRYGLGGPNQGTRQLANYQA